MKRIVSLILLSALLATYGGCWWHEREEHEHDGDRGGYGEHHDHQGGDEHEERR